MYYLIYISTAVKLMTDEELKGILAISRKNNAAKNITGMLLYYGGTFIQLLEGDKHAVEYIYNKIELDTRHMNLLKLITGEEDSRNFPDWTMGFGTANKTLLNDLEGYTDPANADFLQADTQSTPVTILKTFAENNKILR
jgi:hypothetical protein